jgi:CysZ protein
MTHEASLNARYNPKTSGALYHFGWGVRFFFAGLRMMFRHPSLLALSMIPIAATAVVLMGLALGFAWLLGQYLAESLDEFSATLIKVAIFAAALLAGYFLYLPVARVLLAPVAESISRKTHLLNTGSPFAQNVNWLRAILEGLKLVILHLFLGVIALTMGLFVPPIGAPLAIGVAVFLSGLDFFDIPLSARGVALRKKLGVIFANKSLAFGFGGAAYLMLLIPIVNLLLLPVGIIGATLLTDALDRDGEI